MSDNLPTVWPAEAHTLAKHAILREYLKAWMPIMARQSNLVRAPTREILFVDGFAGPGRYEAGEPGSPILALDAALSHSAAFPVPVRFIFIEKDEERFRSLKSVLHPYFARAATSNQIRIDPPVLGDCEHELGGLLTAHEMRGTKFGPALVFLDQFGYSEVPMALVNRILQFPECEVFSYLNWDWMNRFMTDATKWAGITNAFGGEEWKGGLSLPPLQRERFLKQTYVDALKAKGGSKYVCYFSMFDDKDRLLYWLFFCTNNLRGLEEMKGAMWRVDGTGTFKFSDRDGPHQLKLLSEGFDQKWLANHLIKQFQGQAITVGAVWEYILTQTPCRLFVDALRILERLDALAVPNPPAGRQRGAFSEKDMVVQFGFPTMFPIA